MAPTPRRWSSERPFGYNRLGGEEQRKRIRKFVYEELRRVEP
jgi:hypothetical protein